MSFFRFIRLTVLLTILAIVAGGQWLTRERVASWEKPLWLTIYPVAAAPGGPVDAYLDGLAVEQFSDIGAFLERQASRYGKSLGAPLRFQLAEALSEPPPEVPPDGSYLQTAAWSLKMRWWAWRRDREDGLPSPDVQMFVIYHAVDRKDSRERSVGMQKGMFGVVNAVASRGHASLNRVVIAHELLHVLGATDKYDVLSGQPLAPEGLADPGRVPLYPQDKAEIMGGRIAVSAGQFRMPSSLRSCVVGPQTAREIGWL